MSKKRWLGVGVGFCALALMVTLFYGEVLREHVLRHMLYELWLWELRLESLPFGLVWMVFVVAGSLGVYLVILDVLMRGRRSAAVPERSERLGAVQTLARKIELAYQGELARWNVHRAVGDIAIQWIALHEGIRENEARRRLGELFPELYDALDLEFPRSAARQGWLWLNPLSCGQRTRRFQEISWLIDILERSLRETYERTGDHRGERSESAQ